MTDLTQLQEELKDIRKALVSPQMRKSNNLKRRLEQRQEELSKQIFDVRFPA